MDPGVTSAPSRRTGLGTVTGYLVTNRFHVFVMPAVLTYFFNRDLELPLDAGYYAMITATTAGGYIYNQVTDAAEDAHNYTDRYRLFGTRPWVARIAIAACFLTGFVLALRSGWLFTLYGGAANLLASCYSRPLPGPGGRTFRIKELPYVKNAYAGLMWSLMLVATPYLYCRTALDAPGLFVMAVWFGLDYFVELLWDVRDLPGDRATGVRTIPVLHGDRVAARLLVLVHCATCAVYLAGIATGALRPLRGLVFVALFLPTGLVYLNRFHRSAEKVWVSHAFLAVGTACLMLALLVDVVA